MKKLLLVAATLSTHHLAFAQTARNEQKIDYELYKSRYGYHDQYSAIVRPINPGKEDYKAYCRYVAKDIIKKAGSNKILIAIYDNKQAYTSYQSSNNNPTTKQYNFIKQHTVGQYSGVIIDDETANHMLTYYLDCDGTPLAKYQGQEKIK